MRVVIDHHVSRWQQVKKRRQAPDASNSLRDTFGWRLPVSQAIQATLDAGCWGVLEGAGRKSGRDAWSALTEPITWPITHATSSTASSNSAHSFSDRTE